MLSHWPLRIVKHPSWKATDFKGAMAGTAEDQSQNGNVLLCPGGFFPFGKLVGTLKDSLFFVFFRIWEVVQLYNSHELVCDGPLC